MLKSNIKASSKINGLSLIDLAKEVGISKTSIFKYEKEPNVIQLGILVKMSERLSVPIYELVEGIVGEQAPSNETLKKESTGNPYLDIIRNLSESLAAITKDSKDTNTKSFGDTIANMGVLIQTGMAEQNESEEEIKLYDELQNLITDSASVKDDIISLLYQD